jgi:hypothetical protein
VKWLIDTELLSQPPKEHRDARVVAGRAVEEVHYYMSPLMVVQLVYWNAFKELSSD